MDCGGLFLCFVLGYFLCFRFLLSNGFRLKKDSRLSQDSYLYINLISIMKNNSYSVHARLHDCSLTKRYIFFSLIESILYFFDTCLFLFDMKDRVRCLGIYIKPVCNA